LYILSVFNGHCEPSFRNGQLNEINIITISSQFNRDLTYDIIDELRPSLSDSALKEYEKRTL